MLHRKIPFGRALVVSAMLASCTDAPSDHGTLGFTIAEETTFVTEPLLADGRPDYAAALDAMYGEGVTPETNAAVPLAAVLEWDISDEMAERMGVTNELRHSAPRFVGGMLQFDEYFTWRASQGMPEMAVEAGELVGSLTAAMNGPWTTDEHPALAAWLSDMESALEAIEAASRRPRFFVPFEQGLHDDQTPSLMKLRNVANAFRARSNLRAGQDDVAGAAQDLMTLIRLSGRLGQRPRLIELLIAHALLHMGHESVLRLVTTGALPVTELRALRSELEAAAVVPVADGVGHYERFLFLQSLTGADDEAHAHALRRSGELDLDEILRFVNQAYDLTVACMKADTVERARAACSERDAFFDVPLDEEEMEAISRTISEGGELPPETIELVPRILVAMSLPRLGSTQLAENESKVRARFAAVALDLAIHHAERGAFPRGTEDTTQFDLPERGYRFRLLSSENAYVYTAVPEEPGVMGQRSFCLDSEGRFVTRDDGREPELVDHRCAPAAD